MRYRIVMDANAMLFLSCVGCDYHQSECEVCGSDKNEICPVGYIVLEYFFDALRIYDGRSRSNRNVNGRV